MAVTNKKVNEDDSSEAAINPDAPKLEKAKGRSEVELPDGRHIIVMDGDEIPEGGKVVGEAPEPQIRTAAPPRPNR